MQCVLAGAWRLVRYRFESASGAVYQPWGETPAGLILYTPISSTTGSVSATIMPAIPDPTNFAAAYVSYAGRFTVEAADRVIHHVEISNNRQWVGLDQPRRFRLNGDLLELQSQPIPINGIPMVGTVEWQRVGEN